MCIRISDRESRGDCRCLCPWWCISAPVWMIHIFCICSMCTPISTLWMNCVCARSCVSVCVCVLTHSCWWFKEKHIFPHCQHHSSGLLLFKRRGQRSLPFFESTGPALFCPVLSSIGLWLDANKPGGCMLHAFAFQEARLFVRRVFLESWGVERNCARKKKKAWTVQQETQSWVSVCIEMSFQCLQVQLWAV